jgi:general secretion pathway protein G
MHLLQPLGEWVHRHVRLLNARRLSFYAGGFTLLELLIVVAIAAVLAMIAITIFTETLNRSRISKASVEIAEIASLIERQRSQTFEYPDSLDPAPNDPWGRPYIYTKLEGVKGHGSARKDHALNPLNTDFDLFSAGKNGVYKSQVSQKDSLDDVIRARNGAYVGLAEDF